MPERYHQLYLTDILGSGRAIQSYVLDTTYEQFMAERMRCVTVIREFEIGEALGKLPEAVQAGLLDLQWRDIKDFRNPLEHEYYGIDLKIVWTAIKTEFPLLPDATKIILSGQRNKESSRDAL